MQVDTVVVVTQHPDLWGQLSVDLPLVTVNLGHIRPDDYWGRLGSSPSLIEQLTRRGWDPTNLLADYKASARPGVRPDMTVIDPKTGQIAAVIEAKPGPHGERRIRELRDQWRTALPEAPLVVLIGDRSTWIFEKATGEVRQMDNIPSPAELGLTALGVAVSDRGFRRLLCADLDSVPEQLGNVGSFHLILDESLPIGQPGLGDPALLLNTMATNDDAKCVSAVFPMNVLSGSRYGDARQAWGQRWGVAAVIQMPPFTVYQAGVRSALVFLGGDRPQTLMDLVPSGQRAFEPQTGWLRSLQTWLRDSTPGPMMVESLGRSSSWAVAANDPALEALVQRLRLIADVKELGDIAVLRVGRHPGRNHFAENGMPLLTLKAAREAAFDVSQLQRVDSEAASLTIAQSGDIILSTLPDSPLAFLYLGSERVALSQWLVAITANRDQVLPEYLVDYLLSAEARVLMNAGATGMTVAIVAPSVLRKLPVPLFDLETQEEWVASISTEKALRAAAEDLSFKRQAVFSAGESQARHSIDAVSQRASVMRVSLDLADRPDFQMANFYPYPIAYGYRMLQTQMGLDRSCREHLRIAENVLAFAACVSLALIEPQERQSLAELAEKWVGGISPGSWREILVQSTRILRDYSGSAIAQAFVRLAPHRTRHDSFGESAERISQLLNDWKHHRIGDDETSLADLRNEAECHLNKCVRELSFLTRHPIRLVEELDQHRDGRRFAISTTVLAGDHPALRREELNMDSAAVLASALHNGDLFVEVDSQRWMTLHPFVQVRSCHQCRNREVYFVDKVNRDGTMAVLKSFERGHIEESADSAVDLRQW